MSASKTLLTTKLSMPQARPASHLVQRPRLIERLAEGLARPLTLISAPAGFGKTTLIGEWRTSEAGHDFPLAWLSLDAEDNDPTRFLMYLIAAFQTLRSTIGESALALLQSTPPSPPHSILTSLINDLAGMPAPFAAVLDDYHFIVAPPIHEALAFLLDHLPSQMHVIMTTRADPPLSLARLRARNQLAEIRAADLRFTSDEAAVFFNRVMRLNLSPGDSAVLAQRTEGWIAGLQLAALSMQSGEDVPGFIAAFTGTHRYIVDYLIEEVLDRQPQPMQSFLLLTSILDRMTGPACDALTERTDGQLMLQELEQANLFVVALDHERRWYRYHQLFADVLRSRLRQIYPERLSELHRRAARWYEQNGTVSEAISHALAGRDQDHAARLIEQNATSMLMRGEMLTLLNWLPAVEPVAQAHPLLRVVQAWALVLTGQWAAAAQVLQQVEQLAAGAAPADRQAMQGNLAAMQAYLAAIHGDTLPAIEWANRALEWLPEDNVTVRGVVALTLGGAYWLHNDLARSSQAFAEASRLGKATGNIHLAVSALHALANLRVLDGDLRLAAELCQEALQLATGRNGQLLPIAAEACIGLGNLNYEWNNLDAAAQFLNTAAGLSDMLGRTATITSNKLALARLYQAHGDLRRAFDLLNDATRDAHGSALTPILASMLAAQLMRVWLARGDPASAARLAEDNALNIEDAGNSVREAEYLALVRVYLAQENSDAALALLERLQPATKSAGATGRVIELLVLRALILQARRETSPALTALEQALLLAEPHGYVRTFVDEGEPLAWLLRRLGTEGRPGKIDAYARQLLAALGEDYDLLPTAAARSFLEPLPEPLSERELEVLRLVASGKSNQDIARELVLATGTVKKHLSNIFGKLDAQNRTQCVARARELNLL